MALTPNDVLNKQFETTKFRDGYDQDQVDDFLDEVLAEFQRLIAENDQLKSQLASGPASSAAPADSGEADALRAELAQAQAQVAALGTQLAESQQALQTAQQAAAGAAALDGMNSAEYLQLARRVHEEHVREGVAKRDELIAEGEAKSATLVVAAEATALQLAADAQAESDKLLSDARAEAETLVSEATTQRDTLIGTLNAEVATLTTERDGLQTEVDGLKEFERNYRASLKTYLETQLADLAGSSVETPAAEAPAVDATPYAEDTSSGAVEFSESFEVPPIVDAPEATTEGVAWSGFAVDTEAVDTASPFDAAAFGSEPGPVTYEIPGYDDAPATEGDEDQQPPAAPGFGGF